MTRSTGEALSLLHLSIGEGDAPVNRSVNRKVALFVPCFIDQALPQAAIDTVTVLRRVGWDVVFPEDQTCCGQPGFNTGHWEAALPCAERFVRVFSNYEYIVCPSGSCTSMVRKRYPELLASSPSHDQAVAVGKRVYEFAEFLVRIAGVTHVGAGVPLRRLSPLLPRYARTGDIRRTARTLRAVRDIDFAPPAQRGRVLRASAECLHKIRHDLRRHGRHESGEPRAIWRRVCHRHRPQLPSCTKPVSSQ